MCKGLVKGLLKDAIKRWIKINITIEKDYILVIVLRSSRENRIVRFKRTFFWLVSELKIIIDVLYKNLVSKVWPSLPKTISFSRSVWYISEILNWQIFKWAVFLFYRKFGFYIWTITQLLIAMFSCLVIQISNKLIHRYACLKH